VGGSFIEHIEAPLVRAPAAIMPGYGHRSSWHYRSSALPTLVSYDAGLVKGRLCKPVRRDYGRINKTSVDARDAGESALPPKKPPATSAKQRLKRGPQGEPDEMIRP
jgi:hypothetical protein